MMFHFVTLSLIIGICSSAIVPPRNQVDKYYVRDAPQDQIAYTNQGHYLHDHQNYNNGGVVPSKTYVPSPPLQTQPPIITTIRPPSTTTEKKFKNIESAEEYYRRKLEEIESEKSKLAHYSFDAAVNDDINDHSHTRSEQRSGKKVQGMYSYSDGFYHRTVHYVADENGYRVVKEDVKKIGNGPQFNPSGRADVSGSLLRKPYSITIDNDKAPHYVEFGNSKKYSK